MARTSRLSLLAAAALLAGSALQTPSPAATWQMPLSQEASQTPTDEQILRRAARVLAKRGYGGESGRMMEIAAELRMADEGRPRDERAAISQRAAGLLNAPLAERETRLDIIELAGVASAMAGDRDCASAMTWFRSLDPQSQITNVPEILRSEDGDIMRRIVEVLEAGARTQVERGMHPVGELMNRLARFYRERDGIQPGDESEPEPDRAADLTYIEGRAPVLALAAEAYGLEVEMEAAERERGSAWMGWMAAHSAERAARGRVSANEPFSPPAGPMSMDVLIEMIDSAGQILAEADRVADGKRCRDLAEYYRLRERGEAPDNSRGDLEAAAAQQQELESRAAVARDEVRRRRLEALMARRAELESQIQEGRAQLEEMRAALEQMKEDQQRRR